jgi:hypothetical protein
VVTSTPEARYGNASLANAPLDATTALPCTGHHGQSEANILRRLDDFVNTVYNVPSHTPSVDRIAKHLSCLFEGPIILASPCHSAAECVVFGKITDIIEVFGFCQLCLVPEFTAGGNELVIHVCYSSE